MSHHTFELPLLDVQAGAYAPEEALNNSTQIPLRKKISYRKTYKSTKKYDSDKGESKCPFGCCKKSSIGDFLLQKGYLDGFCSDITVKAFGKEYYLHKLILSRSGYFKTLFEGSWSDCNSNMHELIFDEMDNVTAESFELAVASLYGGVNKTAERRLAVNMISTGQFLQMQEVVCSATENIINDMSFDTISKYTNFAYHQNSGVPSERILESARALLCIEGWENGILKWDGIPIDIIVDVVGSDSFFVGTEWDRCLFIIKLIERRIKPKGVPLLSRFENLSLSDNRSVQNSSSKYASFSKLRGAKSMYMNLNESADKTMRTRSSSLSFTRSVSSALGEDSLLGQVQEDLFDGKNGNEGTEEEGKDFDVSSEFVGMNGQEFEESEGYQDTETDVGSSLFEEEESNEDQVSKLKECLNTKVYFCHLSFEQLQLLETLKDCNKEPFMDSIVLRDALWAQSSLHRIIVSSKKNDSNLNIVKVGEAPPADSGEPWYKVPIKDETIYGTPKFLDKVIAENQAIEAESHENDKTESAGTLPGSTPEGEKEYIDFEDDSDCTKDGDDNTRLQNGASTLTDTAKLDLANPLVQNILKQHAPKKAQARKLYKWSKFPPFRFSIAFCDISNLEPEKRMYGKVLWYAGCYWNLYVQKIQKHKRFQLGVYLHRASNKQPSKTGYVNVDVYKNMDIVNGFSPTDTAITISEEDVIPNSTIDSRGNSGSNTEEFINPTTLFQNGQTYSLPLQEYGDDSATNNLSQISETNGPILSHTQTTGDTVDSNLMSYNRQKDKSLLSYEDKRQQISVYFVIRTPSRKSKSNLTCFTSSPSLFSTSQSWGWKSNSMCSFNEDGSLLPGQNKYLKFMVVLGNI